MCFAMNEMSNTRTEDIKTEKKKLNQNKTAEATAKKKKQ